MGQRCAKKFEFTILVPIAKLRGRRYRPAPAEGPRWSKAGTEFWARSCPQKPILISTTESEGRGRLI